MRQRLAGILAGLAALVLGAAQASANDVVVKGPHICCGQCVKIATKVLSKVEGVSEASAENKTKTVKFTAKDDNAAKAGLTALIEAGFFGSATNDGKELKVDVAVAKKGDKADTVTVKGVHVCCGACQKAIIKIFDGSKVGFEGSGPQRTVRIEGQGLDRAEVLQTLRKAGFNGKID